MTTYPLLITVIGSIATNTIRSHNLRKSSITIDIHLLQQTYVKANGISLRRYIPTSPSTPPTPPFVEPFATPPQSPLVAITALPTSS
jgi:hypothetical protein